MMSLDGNINRSLRILYVGNIPHEVAEGNLKELLLEYGLILNFRLFKDASAQYAYCEYEEPEMAVNAIQCLSNYAIKGQTLRVDIAAGNRSPEELASLQEFVSPGISDFSQAMDVSEKAPEEISKAVASLPAEQMFELMKQMKMCIENNPQEARNLLLQNPQLAYALLQAQVIMRIVDPEVALKILERPAPTTAEPETKSVDVKQTLPAVSIATTFSSEGDKDMRQLPPPDYDMRSLPLAAADKDMRQVSGDVDLRTQGAASSSSDARPFDPRFRPADPRAMPGADPRAMPGADPRAMPGADPRAMQGADPRAMPGADPRAMPGADPRAMQGADPRAMQGADPRAMQGADPRAMQGADPRAMQGADPRAMQGADPRAMQGADPRAMQGADPRAMQGADPRAMQGADPRAMQGTDPRAMQGADPRAMQSADPRIMQSADPRSMQGVDPRAIQRADPRAVQQGVDPRAMQEADLRIMQGGDPRAIQGTDPRMMQPSDPRGMQGVDPRMMQPSDPRPNLGGDPRVGMHGSDPRGGIDPRTMHGGDPRIMPGAGMGNPGQQGPGFGPRSTANSDPRSGYDPRSIARGEDPRKPTNVRPPASVPPSSEPAVPEDEEKAALIMQVLQLSEEQISMLPPEQRQSIMVLKEQIARSQLL